MKYNFDEIINRKGTNSLKYDFAIERGKPSDVFPLWVADMDFKTPIEVTDALSKRVNHGIFGYSDPKESYYKSISEWFFKRHKLVSKYEDIITTPSVVFSINTAINAFTKEGDSILVQKPVYYPFFKSITNNGRKVVNNSLINNNGYYTVDLKDFEQKIIDNNVKLFILCSPHNPVGRTWKIQELKKMGDICKKHNVLVFSDEMHCDFDFTNIHIPFSSVDPTFKDFSMIANSPSKTFNLASLQCSHMFISNEIIRNNFKSQISKVGIDNTSVFGMIATETAYNYGEDWLEQLKNYLKDNINFVDTFLKENLPFIKFRKPESSYLIWLDFNNLNISHDKLDEIIIKKANLWVNSGNIFGEEGIGFQRINIATQKENLEKALLRLKDAFSEYREI